jgi:hypothetical protein
LIGDFEMIKVSSQKFTNRTMNNFSMTFPNGYTVSLAMGEGMYSTDSANSEGFSAVEVAAWNKDGEWVKLGDNDDVIGWQSPEEVLAIMNKIAAL